MEIENTFIDYNKNNELYGIPRGIHINKYSTSLDIIDDNDGINDDELQNIELIEDVVDEEEEEFVDDDVLSNELQDSLLNMVSILNKYASNENDNNTEMKNNNILQVANLKNKSSKHKKSAKNTKKNKLNGGNVKSAKQKKIGKNKRHKKTAKV